MKKESIVILIIMIVLALLTYLIYSGEIAKDRRLDSFCQDNGYESYKGNRNIFLEYDYECYKRVNNTLVIGEFEEIEGEFYFTNNKGA